MKVNTRQQQDGISKRSGDPELMMCRGEAGEERSSLALTLDPLSAVIILSHSASTTAPLRPTLTDISQIASCAFKDDSL